MVLVEMRQEGEMAAASVPCMLRMNPGGAFIPPGTRCGGGVGNRSSGAVVSMVSVDHFGESGFGQKLVDCG